MKALNEVVARAVILFCLYDRCVVELEFYNGRHYSEQEREEQRQTIWWWLTEKDYVHYMTEEEREFFSMPIDIVAKEKVNLWSHQVECIGPLLWTAGMVNNLQDYSGYDTEDYSNVLQIGINHNLAEMVSACQMKTEGEVAFEADKACLWHWRAIELGSTPPNGQRWGECIKSIFGEECEALLRDIPQAKTAPGDFLVGKKMVSRLSRAEKTMLQIITKWRHHVFEWITSDAAWDEVSVDT